MTKPNRTARETWETLEAHAREDEIARFRAKTSNEVDASLRAAGHDPAAVRAEGDALAKKLIADRDRLAWQVEAAAGLARERARFEARGSKRVGLSKDELRARIAVARMDSRLSQPAAVMFRNRKIEEANEDELREILEEMEALAEGTKPEK